MKRLGILVLLSAVAFLNACSEKRSRETASGEQFKSEYGAAPAIVFDSLVNDMGRIKEGEQVIAWFDYKNDGNAPLIINRIEAGCGCTVPAWSKVPLEPGEDESVKVIFNSRGKKGSQNIRITVHSNAKDSPRELRLKGVVE